MRTLTKTVVAATAGALSWSFTEYGLHRFAMHEMKGKGMASREHLSHHADVRYFSPTSKKLLSAASTSAVVTPATWAIFGRRTSLAYTTGMLTMYAGYEVAHRRSHTHPPTHKFGRWMRRSHLHHHFGAPMRNFGVTSPVWDKLFRTYDDPGIVTIPRRMAPDWMIDHRGELRPEFAGDYIVKGGSRATNDDRTRDHDDAFANRAPELV